MQEVIAMSAIRQPRATVADLAAYDGKAELVNGRIVALMPTGRKPNRVAGRIYRSLDDYAQQCGVGEAYTDNMGFTVAPLSSGRESFSPDASYYVGPFPPNDMGFIQGPPTLAAEVRSDNDYGPAAELAMANKRADYFEAGAAVVLDIDPKAECVHVYYANTPGQPVTYHRGEIVEAEPALPGWRLAVDSLFG
jgi:Uma2 family endonuclease